MKVFSLEIIPVYSTFQLIQNIGVGPCLKVGSVSYEYLGKRGKKLTNK